MSFLAPLGLTLGVLIPILVLFYLLKVRRQEYVVGSTYLWQDLLRDLAAHEPWQRFHWSILLILQLLVVGLLVFALARPFYVAQAEEVVHAVIVLDAGASMQATDVQPSRFEAARRAAKDTVRGLAEGSVGTVILAGVQPTVLMPSTGDRAALERAIDGAEVTYGRSDMGQALALAGSLGAADGPNGGQQRLRIFLFTDGSYGGIGGDEAEPLDIRLTQIGTSGDNQGITALAARADPQNANQFQVFGRVRNYADAPFTSTLSLVVDGNVTESREVTLAPEGDDASAQDYVFTDLPIGARAVEARLAGTDVYPVDNTAYTVLNVGRPAEVLLVSNGNLFLEKVLSLLPAGDVSRVAPRRYPSIDADRYDIVVFDGFVPDVLPRGNALIVNPTESSLFTIEGEVRRPVIRDWNREDPLLHFVDLRDVAIARAQRITPPSWARTLVQGDTLPLMLAGEQDGRRVVLLPFDLRQSNLPLSAAFPILMANILGYLQPSTQAAQADLRPGEPMPLQPVAQAEEIIVRRQDGPSETFRPEGQPLTFEDTTHPGLYTILQRAAGQTLLEEPFAVNAADEVESDVRPKSIALGSGRTLQAGGPVSLVPVNHEIWTWLVPPAIVLLLVEWFWFHRRS
ncbi:MAG: VWA domain-containing protein [Chloroflexi bacterium]|nr:VWA domain-containing protein [Chloroflexota bacterium]